MAYKRHKMYQKKTLNITHHQGNAKSKPTIKQCYLTPVSMAFFFFFLMLVNMSRNWNPFALLIENVKWCSLYGRQYEDSSEN